MGEKPKRKRRVSNIWKWIIGGILLLILGFSLFISYIGFVLSQGDLRGFFEGVSVVSEGDDARENSLSYTGILIPENATDIYFDYYAWQDYEAYIRFSLLVNEVELWLETSALCFDVPLDGSNFPRMENNFVSWWQPADAETYITGQQCGNNPYYNILVDQTDNNTWIIYIEVFTV